MSLVHAPFHHFDERVGVASSVTGTITASAQTVECNTTNFGGATVAFTGTFAGISGAFEASFNNGTTYVAVSAVSVAGGNAGTSVTTLSAAAAYEIYCPGATNIRFRSTAYTSGTMTVIIIPTVHMQDIAPALSNSNITLAALPAGTALIGDVGSQVRATTGGLASIHRLLSSAATTNATSVKASAGRLYRITAHNNVAAIKYLKLYNKASAPTVGTDTPVVTLALPGNTTYHLDFETIGQYFATGIAFAITGAAADADTTAVASGDIICLNMWYA